MLLVQGGAPDAQHARVRVMSYNILADHLAHEHAAELYQSSPRYALVGRACSPLMGWVRLCSPALTLVSSDCFGPLGSAAVLDPCAKPVRQRVAGAVPPTWLAPLPCSAPQEWGYRRKLIVREIEQYLPDVVCLQEVDRFQELRASLEEQG